MRKLTKEEMKAVSGAGCRYYTDNYGNTQVVCSPSIPNPPSPTPPPACQPYSSAWYCN